MDFSASVTVPHAIPDQEHAVIEQLLQDGFLEQDLHVPKTGTPEFETLVHDAKEFAREAGSGPRESWPLRGGRWLNRFSTVLTGKMFSDLSSNQRRALAHAAITLAGRSELLT